METVRKFTYPGDRLSIDGGCEAAVAARTECGMAMFKECGEFLHGRHFLYC